jgi:hypothetical protein
MTTYTNGGCKRLACAVLEAAVKRYKSLMKRDIKYPFVYKIEIERLEAFFYSDWFECLVGLMEMDSTFIRESLGIQKDLDLAQSKK